MDALINLINELLGIALQAFTLFIDLILSILQFFVVLFQSILGAFHA
jgi:hypothetical protein